VTILKAGPSGVNPSNDQKMGVTNASKPNQKAQISLRWALKEGKHPFSVQPLGNKYLSTHSDDARISGLGKLAVFPDPLLLDIVHMLDGEELAKLAIVSKACMILVYHDDPYRLKTMLTFGADGWTWKGNWRNTWKHASGFRLDGPTISCPKPYYSDTLFQSWYCANLDLEQFVPRRPNLPRIQSHTSVKQFMETYAQQNKPVIIEGLLSGEAGWKAFHIWTREYLLQQYGDALMRAEASVMSLRDYFAYACSTTEESPLYIFDKDFAEKWKLDDSWFDMPHYFPDDLFSLLPSRPDYQWLILGPPRSGSTFHIDPNATSAYNALIHGRKLWVFYPPHLTPPGIVKSLDGSEVSAPVSVTEWFCNYIQQARMDKGRGMMEAVQDAGDVVFVPHGWWHCVLNLDETIAITQNFVAPENLKNVLTFLRDKRDQVSGYGDLNWCDEDPDTCRADNDLYEQFLSALQTQRPELYEEWLQHADVRKRRRSVSPPKPSKHLFKAQTSFSFGFSD
jgi:hypothetical protein